MGSGDPQISVGSGIPKFNAAERRRSDRRLKEFIGTKSDLLKTNLNWR